MNHQPAITPAHRAAGGCTPTPQRSSRRGRPRSFEDEQIFRITTRLLLDEGITAVTLQRVAHGVGVSHQAVAQRFVSKAGLIERYQQWLTMMINGDMDRLKATIDSPLEAIRTLVVLPINQRLADGALERSQAAWVLLSLELKRDPALARQEGEHMAAFNQDLVRLVVAAQQRGELLAANAESIAEEVLAAVTGAAVQWVLHPVGEILAPMCRCRDAALRPYLPATTSDAGGRPTHPAWPAPAG